jgi:uncharacterized protein (DUF1697 family)
MATRPTKSARPRPAESHIALLRAINVGGNNMIAMKDLVAVFVDQGCKDVRTYIQSGNVVFDADAKVLAALERTIPDALRERFGLEVPVVLRSARELEAALNANPFPRADPKSVYVAFLRDQPSARLVKALDPCRSPGDEFVVSRRDIHIRFGSGAAKTKLTVGWFDTQLATVTTMRNLRTVRTLCEMSAR